MSSTPAPEKTYTVVSIFADEPDTVFAKNVSIERAYEVLVEQEHQAQINDDETGEAADLHELGYEL